MYLTENEKDYLLQLIANAKATRTNIRVYNVIRNVVPMESYMPSSRTQLVSGLGEVENGLHDPF